MNLFLQAVGLQAPGLEGWENALPVLQGVQPYQAEPLSRYSPQFLPANERRRTTDTIKLALRTAEDTSQHLSPKARSQLPAVFACVDGDTAVFAKMAQSTLTDEPMVSPIHFHNSVHNAPAGYWMIGQHNQKAASALSAGEHQLGNSLLETIGQLEEAEPHAMLILYDLPIDPIIENHQPEIVPFGAGLILSLQPGPSPLATLEIEITQGHSYPPETDWFGANQAAQILPLLQALARQKAASFAYPLSPDLHLSVHLQPGPGHETD
ncbi:MAG: beta-ketoacyl synthase chain length factor [Hydrogenovibrio sp.]|uniref:beta-ketoacyl synthase chain length factor n=1 Tax=Hydrogenovibrio sp. TaxID=2065821 RepID=UPI002870850B|nr:beta-ketoacyl synthase chain length factor [Hydrogenovibrio sp.]MDR9499684.1 beta-ketoacyl synthase chain length factor [Hydrogenovibrio sp.]